MSHGKQFTLYTNNTGPNGWKVAFALEYLGLSYEPVYLNLQAGEQKKAEYTKLNPNGRIPTIVDHKNGDLVVWESGAILTYLVDTYDPEHRISAADPKDKVAQLQWLFFQASGQGPYFGQVYWFKFSHPEKIPSAIERYQKEIVRVLGVLESVLQDREWLVAGKLTVADLSFITWNNATLGALIDDIPGLDVEKQFPKFLAWHRRMVAEPTVARVLAVQKARIDAQNAGAH